MDRAELIAQQLVQRGAEHALAELQRLGVTAENCAAMLISIREGLIEVHAAAAERGIHLLDYSSPGTAGASREESPAAARQSDAAPVGGVALVGWEFQPDEEGLRVVSPSGDACYLWDLHAGLDSAHREVLLQLCQSIMHERDDAAAPHPQAAQAQVAEGIERAAKWVDVRREAFTAEHGAVDPDTGSTEYGTGVHAQAKLEYEGELAEIAEGLRSIATSTPTDSKGGV
jgi:hypothetical protein